MFLTVNFIGRVAGHDCLQVAHVTSRFLLSQASLDPLLPPFLVTRHSHKQDTAFLLLSSLVKAPWVKGTKCPHLSGQWCTDGGECIGQISSRGHYRKTVTPLQTGRHHDRKESMGEAGVTVKDWTGPFPPTPAFIIHRNILTLRQTPARTVFSTDNWEPECLDIYDMYIFFILDGC